VLFKILSAVSDASSPITSTALEAEQPSVPYQLHIIQHVHLPLGSYFNSVSIVLHEFTSPLSLRLVYPRSNLKIYRHVSISSSSPQQHSDVTTIPVNFESLHPHIPCTQIIPNLFTNSISIPVAPHSWESTNDTAAQIKASPTHNRVNVLHLFSYALHHRYIYM